MLTYSFEHIGKESLYTYLYQCIKEDIVSGKLSVDEKLPSKRAFAKHLNISTITIENTYSLLMTEGYIYSLPKKGYFVSDIQELIPTVEKDRQLSLPLNAPAPEPTYFADFTSNQTRPDNFPFSIWTRLTKDVMADHSEALLKNPPAGGILPLRQAIAEHLQAFRGMYVNPEQIIVGAGTEYLYGLLIQLLGFDNVYAVENPGYQKISAIYTSHNVPCRYINMDKHGVLVDALEQEQANVIHISPSHHFPTGITMPISRRYELLNWASKADNRYIIEDDYDSEFRLTGKPIPTLQSIDMSDRVIYINTFTKSLASTIRISYMVLPPQLLAIYQKKLRFYACTVSNFEQYTLAAFISGGYYEKHINRMRNFYRKLRDKLLEEIKQSPLSSLVSISEEDAGLHFLMQIHTDLSDDAIVEHAANEGIRITSLSQYNHKKNVQAKLYGASTHTFVINYSNLPAEHIKEAVERLYRALK